MIHFKVPEIPPTTNKTVRFPIDVVEEVERYEKQKGKFWNTIIKIIWDIFLMERKLTYKVSYEQIFKRGPPQ